MSLIPLLKELLCCLGTKYLIEPTNTAYGLAATVKQNFCFIGGYSLGIHSVIIALVSVVVFQSLFGRFLLSGLFGASATRTSQLRADKNTESKNFVMIWAVL